MRNWNFDRWPWKVGGKKCFEPTYEELKQATLSAIVFSISLFWAYLWGIETMGEWIVWIYRGLGFEPTYEELKPIPATPYAAVPNTFWAYLWGIETKINQPIPLLFYHVLSLPMRNWNAGRFSNTSHPHVCFEPTYEELKQVMEVTNILFKACFEPTYEELKHLSSISSRVIPSPVLSLPMRNWNERVKGTFEDVLLSFEPTYEELKHWKNTLYNCSIFCFEPTYEELKQRSWIAIILLAYCFEPTYEELKLLCLIRWARYFDLFWAYLWGIETEKQIIPIQGAWEFWAYLWGIETISKPSAYDAYA